MLFSLQPLDWPALVVIFIFMIPICIVDLRSFLIPNALAFSGCIVLFAYLIFFHEERFLPALAHGALGFAVIFVFWFLFKKQVGLGDAKLSFFLAAGLGFIEWWGVLLFASFIAATYGLIMVGLKKMAVKDKLPLAPFFGAGVIFIVCMKLLIS